MYNVASLLAVHNERFRVYAAKCGRDELVRRVLPCSVISHNEQGKPFIENSYAHISISHSGGYCVLALSAQPIGVDIERLSRFNVIHSKQRFIDRFMPECKSYGYLAYNMLSVWTRKEAYLKLLGTGLRAGLASVDVFNLPNVTFDTVLFDGEHMCVVAMLKQDDAT